MKRTKRPLRSARSRPHPPAGEAREILLVGGDGFLGSAVARALIAAGRRVTTLSRGRHAPVDGAERLVADRRDPRSLAAALAGRRFDLTVDMAAYEAVDVETLWRVPGVALGRTVMVSSGQVYMVTTSRRASFREPDSRRPLMAEPDPASRDHPQWTYGIGKRAAEAAFMALRRHHGVRALVLRMPVLQGEGDPTLRLWAWIERVLDGGPLLIPDDGGRATRFLDVADAARLIEHIAAGRWPRGAVYNVAAPRITRLDRFLKLVAAAAETHPEFVYLPAGRFAELGLEISSLPFAHRWSSVLDPARAKRDLGFVATGPEHYLGRIVRWHLDHRPRDSHPGYDQRAREIEVAEKLRGTAPGTPAGSRATGSGRA